MLSQPPADRRRLVILVTATTLALAVVAIASRAGLPRSARLHNTVTAPRGGSALVGGVAAILVISLVLFVIALGSVLLTGRRGHSEDETEPERRPMATWERVVAIAVPLLLIGAVVAVIVTSGPGKPARQPPIPPLTGAGSGAATTPVTPPRQSPDRGSAIEIGAAAGLLIVIAAGVAMAVISRRRPEPDERDEQRAAVAEAARFSIEDLRRERDPRTAIIAAYARMETLLGSIGVPRHAAETQYEYLRRVMVAADAPPVAVGDLTELFHEAKFSRHELTGADRDRALASLVEIREATEQ